MSMTFGTTSKQRVDVGFGKLSAPPFLLNIHKHFQQSLLAMHRMMPAYAIWRNPKSNVFSLLRGQLVVFVQHRWFVKEPHILVSAGCANALLPSAQGDGVAVAIAQHGYKARASMNEMMRMKRSRVSRL
jgi:hypothetical protein